MEKIEKLKKSKMYIDMLSNGIDPVTNQSINADTMYNPEIVSCFKYISDILENDVHSLIDKERKSTAFYITKEQYSQLKLFNTPLKISDIANEINRVTENNRTKKLIAVNINDWLESIGMLEKSTNGSRMATEYGNNIGIISVLKHREDGTEYYTNIFNAKAQSFIYQHINDIIEIRKNKKSNELNSNQQFNTINFPDDMNINQFINQNRNKCFIMSIGIYDFLAVSGSYKSVLLYNGNKKMFKQTGISTDSSNKCILYGLIEAAKAMKSPVDVVILTSTGLGFKSYNSADYNLCMELLEILRKVGCEVSLCICENKDIELRNFIKSLEE